MKKITTLQLVRISLLAALLLVQELVFSFLPNIQLTVLLLIIYSRSEGFWKTIIIILIHVLLDNLIMGSFNLFYVLTMFIGWAFIPIVYTLLFPKVEKIYWLAFFSVLCSLLYSWAFLVANCIFYNINFLSYFISDIYFEILLAASSFLSVLWLYNPLYQTVKKLSNNW